MQSEKHKAQNKNINPSLTSKATSMADLMAKISAKKPFVSVKKGEVLQGTITKLTSAEILVDINAKTEAVVLEKDKRILKTLLSNLHVGDVVTVSVLNPESDSGNPVVSLRRHIQDILWKELEEKQKKQEAIEGVVTETTRGGFLVDTTLGLSGFLPNSQTALSQGVSVLQNPQDLIGKKIDVYVLELARDSRKIILSQKKVLAAADFDAAVGQLKHEQKIIAIIANVTSFGLFVGLQIGEHSVDGLIHISEISWDEVSSVSGYSAGQEVECMVIGIDKEAKRVDLSIKRLTPDPFEDHAKQISIDQKVKGTVTKITSTGVFLDLEQGVGGLIRREKIPPNVLFNTGDTVMATVSQIDTKRRKILLTPVLKEKPIGYR